MVQDGEVVIVDEFTGRLMVGRRWSDGLHQAVEAKEGVKIQAENQTLASITFQNYFRMYGKLAGMTGTADTEAYEFQEIYGLETVVIPTHRPMVRQDRQDQVFRTAQREVQRDHRGHQGLLRPRPAGAGGHHVHRELRAAVGSAHPQAKLPHEVLNAKQHAREAGIVAEAGRPGQITIATNMAGRGTDIVLGGNAGKQIDLLHADTESVPEADKAVAHREAAQRVAVPARQVLAAGGLHIIGTERHESRRIDNQLRGRAGRQGDAGSSRFYLSMDDPLLKIFAGDRLKAIMDRLKLPEGEAIEAGMVTRSIESAQRKVEARNFDIRKQLLEYDDVANDQRKVVYADRNAILESSDLSKSASPTCAIAVFTDLFRQFVPADSVEEQWDIAGPGHGARERMAAAGVSFAEILKQKPDATDDDLLELLLGSADASYQAKVEIVGQDAFSGFERSILLQAIDQHWREHLSALDYLRQGIHLRGYAQKNPKQEYKREAFEIFGLMQARIRNDVTRVLMTVRIQSAEEAEAAERAMEAQAPDPERVAALHADFDQAAAGAAGADPESIALALSSAPMQPEPADAATVRRFGDKIGRNDPCPCGSGKKYKQCHGRLA